MNLAKRYLEKLIARKASRISIGIMQSLVTSVSSDEEGSSGLEDPEKVSLRVLHRGQDLRKASGLSTCLECVFTQITVVLTQDLSVVIDTLNFTLIVVLVICGLIVWLRKLDIIQQLLL